jgi:hypothetical protein
VAIAILSGVVIASFALYPSLFAAFLGRPFPIRALVALAVIFPMGFLMGMPFPVGIRQASRSNPRIIPWAWAVNGFASVASSSLCVLLAMELGFSSAAFLAGVCYLMCAGLNFALKST